MDIFNFLVQEWTFHAENTYLFCIENIPQKRVFEGEKLFLNRKPSKKNFIKYPEKFLCNKQNLQVMVKMTISRTRIQNSN